MRNKIVKNYKNNTIFGSILMIGLMILLVGFSYAFFVYNKTGLYTHTITGGKMSIIYNEATGNNITIDNAYPLRDEEALTKGLEFEFTISGYNESDKNIYYAIEMDYGEDVTDKERFLDNNIKLSLYENDEEVFENQVFSNLDNQDIHYGVINQGTSVDSPVTNNYKLRIWINDYVIISDTVSDDLSTWTDFEWDWLEEYNKKVYNFIMGSDNQYLSEYGISIYTTSEFQNMYANFKVNVKADLTYDDVGFITYDANGGEFTPEKTSLTTGRVTTQKPVMRTEVASQTGTNLKGKLTQIENEVEYQYKGFLGWSTTPNGEVEYRAGDYYSGNGEILYAIYDDGVNIMDVFSDAILKYAGESNLPQEKSFDGDNKKTTQIETTTENDVTNYIAQIYFINDLQENINERYDNAIVKDDLTLNNNGSVKAWIEIDEDNLTSILYIGAEGTIYLSKGNKLFSSFTNCNYIDLQNVDTSMVTDMSSMFNMQPIVQPKHNKNDVFNSELLASIGGSIESNVYIDNLTSFNTSNVTDMSYMFKGYNSFELDISSFNTSKVRTMLGMFEECNNLTMIDIRDFDTSNVENMANMFKECENLSELDVSNFDTSKVMDMSSMFYNCDSLSIIDVSNFDTSKVINMSNVFYRCENLFTIDVSNFDTSNVADMSYMFCCCYNLVELDVSNFDTSNVENMASMFEDCQYLEMLDVSGFDTSQVTDISYMFYNCFELSLLDVSNFITFNVVSFGSTFRGCDNLSFIDVSNFDTRNAKDMSGMFAYCSNLKELDVSNFETNKISSMSLMFIGCQQLKEIDVSNFDTSQVYYMGGMFENCGRLTTLDVSNFDTSNVRDMGGMFEGLSLTRLDLSNFDTSNVTDMSGMFHWCDNLVELNISSFDTSKVTTMQSMFMRCYSLKTIDITNFNTTSLNKTSDMFNGCSSLTTIYYNQNMNTGLITSSSNMFSGCVKLVGAASYNSSSKGINMANPDTGYFTYKTN